jgi:hypothetical protein
MFKNVTVLLLFIGLTTTANAQIKTPQPSPSSKIEQVVGLTKVNLEYSRPAMRGRTIFGDLVPYGKVWRTGANANTKITFEHDVTVDGQKLEKGSYAIYTTPGETSWEVMFYSDSNNAGLPSEWDDAKVVAKTTAEVHKMPFKVESFTISFDDLSAGSGTLGFIWEDVYVGVSFEVPTEKIASKSIEAVMAGPSNYEYFQAAVYYHSSGKDLKQAMEWMKKAVAVDNPPFWMLRGMSLIQADMGDKPGAIATAKKSLAAAQKANNADYIKMNKESITKWQQ